VSYLYTLYSDDTIHLTLFLLFFKSINYTKSSKQSIYFSADCIHICCQSSVVSIRCRAFQALAFPSHRIRRDRLLPADNLLFSLHWNKFPSGLVSRPTPALCALLSARDLSPAVFAFHPWDHCHKRLYNLSRKIAENLQNATPISKIAEQRSRQLSGTRSIAIAKREANVASIKFHEM